MKTVDKELFEILSHTGLRTDQAYATSIVDVLKFRPKQTVQTQIRLLLKNQSDQGLLCLLF